MIGVDDDHGRAMSGRACGQGDRRVARGRGRSIVRARRLRHRRAAPRRRRRTGPSRSPDLRPIASLRGAHNWQNAAAAYAVVRRAGARPGGRAPASRAFPGLPTAWRGRADRAACATSTTARRPIPRPPPARSPASIGSTGLPAASAKEGGLDALLPWLDAGAPGLPDRWGRRSCSSGLSWACFRAADAAILRLPSASRRGGAPRSRAAAGGPAGAGLRVVRPVRRFRSARRHLQSAGRRAAEPALAERWAGRRGRERLQPHRSRRCSARWWWTVDRPLLAGFGVLALSGLVFVFASSPPVASRLGMPPLHFVARHLMYLVPAALLLLGTSLLSPKGVHRLAVGCSCSFWCSWS